MFVNNKKMLDDGVETDVTITEFFPGIDDKTVVPVSKLGGTCPLYAFGEVNPDALSIGPMTDKYVLSLKEYSDRLTEFIKDVKDVSDYDVNIYFDITDMYYRYKFAVDRMAIAGVSSLIISNVKDANIIPSSTVPEFTPGDGVFYKVDLESYWKSLIFVMPNMLADASTAIRMYDNYVVSNKFDADKKSYPSTLILEVESLSELVDIISDALDETELSSKQITSLVNNDELESSPDMGEYYKVMLNKYNVSQKQASGLLLYAFDNHYKLVYEQADMANLLRTNSVMIASLPKITASRGYNGSEMTSLL